MNVKPCPYRSLLALMLVVPMLGCAARRPEKPIVLRPSHPPRRTVQRPPARPATVEVKTEPSKAAPASPAPTAEESGLSPADKEALFRDFDRYLSTSGTRTGARPQ